MILPCLNKWGPRCIHVNNFWTPSISYLLRPHYSAREPHVPPFHTLWISSRDTWTHLGWPLPSNLEETLHHFPSEDQSLTLVAAGYYSSLITPSSKKLQCLLKVRFWWRQQNHIYKKHRWCSEVPKMHNLLTLTMPWDPVLTTNRIGHKGQPW